ncbi:MAG: ATP-dependent helicase [Phycisphaerae bacterium]|nr:ATP-dependent helicase [Phycisphaerae bacterium]
MATDRTPNAAQRQAIEHEGGPLVVLAGPGTGKTFVIIQRVKHLIEHRGIEPERVLVVTFTIRAADELRARLASFIKPELALRVQAHTFNGLGAKLINRYADVLGLPARTTMIDAVQRRRILRDTILSERLFGDSRATGLDSLIVRVERAIEGMTNLGRLPDECERAAALLSARVESEAATMSSDEAEAARQRAKRFADEARLYALSQSRRRREGLISFADQVVLPIELLKHHPGPAATVRSDLHAVIVDEFQDCNPGQIELLRLLIGPEHRPRPDVCVVGDDDQAIYGFRGGDDQTFQKFATIWRDARVVTLTENYRSTEPIIRLANDIISRAGVRFRADKVLDPAPTAPVSGRMPEAVKLEHDSDDAEVIAATILAERAAPGGAEFGDIAVIARTRNDLDRAEAALSLYDIPVARASSRSVLDDEGVQDVLAWVQWLVDPAAIWASLRVLARPPFGVPAHIAAGFMREYKAQRSHHEQRVQGVADPGEYARWLRSASPGSGPHAVSVNRCLDRLEQLREATANRRADDALFRIISLIDAAHAELLPSRERAARVTALLNVLAIAREKQSRLEPPGELRQFWEYFEELTAAGALVPDENVEEDDADDPGGRVHLLTAHAAKGLEFDLVFVPRIVPRFGYPKGLLDDDVWTPPPELIDPAFSPDPRDAASRRLDEERRLFFVACTRARRRLVLLAKYNKKPSASAAHFFEELVPHKEPAHRVTPRNAKDLLADAARIGVGAPDWADPDAAHDNAEAKTVRSARECAADWALRARRRARLDAAAALEAADAPDLTESELDALRERLEQSLRTLAVVRSAEVTGGVPGWASGTVADVGRTLVALRRRVETDGDRDSFSLIARPLRGPLELSYTFIRNYVDCPRCFYLRRVLKVPEQESPEAGLGSVIHSALEEFYGRWSRADADGKARPGRSELLRIGVAKLHANLSRDQIADPLLAEQVQAQLGLLWDRLHQDDVHVLEIEKTIRFQYAVDDVQHTITAKIDRIDQLPDRSLRVIDYKTGNPSKSKTRPDPDDLQLGIYRLALDTDFGQDPIGRAEYWVLATGERGTLSFADMKLDKVRATIDRAVRGMAMGQFPAATGCSGDCKLFRD